MLRNISADLQTSGFELIISKKKGQEFSSIKEENKAINLRTSKEDCSRRNSSYTRGESAFRNCAHCGDGVARGVVIRYTGDTTLKDHYLQLVRSLELKGSIQYVEKGSTKTNPDDGKETRNQRRAAADARKKIKQVAADEVLY